MLLKELDLSSIDFAISYFDSETNTTVELVNSNTVYAEVRNYDERKLYKELGTAEIQLAYTEFTRNWIDVFKALAIEYKPLENYNMIESNHEYLQLDNIKHTNNNESTTTDKTTTFDDSTFRNNTQTTDNSTNTQTTEYMNNLTDDNNINSNQITTVKNMKSGNLGVTTSQQMLQAEIDIRIKNYVKRMVKEFVDEISYYI